MKKISLHSTLYQLGLLILIPVFLGGCGNTRYDDQVKYTAKGDDKAIKYTASKEGTKTRAAQYGSATSKYSQGVDVEKTKKYRADSPGVKTRVDQYDNATAYYTIRKKNSNVPYSDVVRVQSADEVVANQPDQAQADELPMVLEISDVLFDFDKAIIKADYVPELDKWVAFFKENPEETAQVFGHTDSTGPTTYNQGLSERRAQAVVNYMVEHGIEKDRLTAKGFGETQPRVDNDTKENRQKNRRVEMNQQ